MKRQLSLRQYREIDLTAFAIMLLISEVFIRMAIRWFPNEIYTVSVAGAVTAIVMMRWSGYAGIHAALAGLIYCFLSHGTGKQYLIYVVGNLLSLAALLVFKVWDKETVRKDSTRTVIFAVCVQVFMQVGRGLVALVLGSSPMSCLGFLTTDALSGVFTVVVVWIARRLDGIFEDQKHYLLRIHTKGEEKGGSQ